MRTHRVSISFGQVAVAVMLATSVACTSVPSGTRATNAEPIRSADSASAGPSASASSQLGYPSPATPSGDISSSAGPSESPNSPRVLPSSASGKDLSLTDIFASKGEWKQARFDLADQTDVPGMGVALNTCGTNNPAELELRLAHRFMHLSMDVAQANNSPSSSNKIVVEVTANGKQQDSRQVPFDRIQPFDISAQDVNAAVVRLWIDQASCVSGQHQVIAVVSKLRVS
jgi:hypothetical protein